MNSSLPVRSTRRKQLGAWYTPPELVEPLVDWAVRDPNALVLDPAVGDGAFLQVAARRVASRSQLHGFDINADAVAVTRRTLGSVGPESPKVSVCDFLLQESAGGLFTQGGNFDAVVGNPPYVRFQLFAESAARAESIARASGVKLSGLASSWAVFAIHAASFLTEQGRLALILPEELIGAGYAEAVRRFFRRRFAETVAVSFEGEMFPDSQERVVAVFCEGRAGEQGGRLRLLSAPSARSLAGLVAADFPGAERFAPGDEPHRWRPQDSDDGSEVLERLVTSGYFTPLREIAKVGIGWVSGANDFFVLRPSEVERRGLPKESLHPALVSAKSMPGAICGPEDERRLSAADAPCRLWDGSGADSSIAVRRYIKEGVATGIADRYKCRVRSPWYVVPGLRVPDAFLTYMSDVSPRLALNKAGFTCSNNLHAVEFLGLPAALHERFVFGFCNTATRLSAESVGRRYGGGVLKLEPSEAGRVLVPTQKTLAAVRKSSALLKSVDTLLRTGRVREASKLADEEVLTGVIGLSADDVLTLACSADRRLAARKGARRRAATAGLSEPICPEV